MQKAFLSAIINGILHCSRELAADRDADENSPNVYHSFMPA